MIRYGTEKLSELLPYPAHDMHKYSRGKLMVFAGSTPYPGAAILSSHASQRVGAGYTHVITAPANVSTIQQSHPSLVVSSWQDLTQDVFSSSTQHNPVAYVVGPGFAAKKKMEELTRIILREAHAPILVDGGALNALTSKAGRALCKERFIEGHDLIITPHAGEAARLARVFDFPTDDPACLSFFLSLAYGAIVVLKGPDTYISDGEEVYTVTNGTPALAKAGTGDVLSGMIGGLLAQGMDALDAAVLGVTLHGKAGSLAAGHLTTIAVTAEDVIDHIPEAIKAIKMCGQGYSQPQLNS